MGFLIWAVVCVYVAAVGYKPMKGFGYCAYIVVVAQLIYFYFVLGWYRMYVAYPTPASDFPFIQLTPFMWAALDPLLLLCSLIVWFELTIRFERDPVKALVRLASSFAISFLLMWWLFGMGTVK